MLILLIYESILKSRLNTESPVMAALSILLSLRAITVSSPVDPVSRYTWQLNGSTEICIQETQMYLFSEQASIQHTFSSSWHVFHFYISLRDACQLFFVLTDFQLKLSPSCQVFLLSYERKWGSMITFNSGEHPIGRAFEKKRNLGRLHCLNYKPEKDIYLQIPLEGATFP